jgi:23S rRNA pseudouridine2605 synthase
MAKTTPPSTISLSKFISQSGFTSRRKAASLVKQGHIFVNEEKCINPGTRINPQKDTVTSHQNNQTQPIKLPKKHTHLILNKPTGYLCTTSDPYQRKTIYQLLPKKIKIYPVGRLDQDSRGLLLLTNDGSLIDKLTNPKYHIPKIYQVKILGKVSQTKIDQLNSMAKHKPLQIADITITKPIKVKIINNNSQSHTTKRISHPSSQVSPRPSEAEREGGSPKSLVSSLNSPTTTLQFILHEGKKRQIRRMCAQVHLHILDLKRTQIGNLKIGNLEEGKWRELSKKEVKQFPPV